MNTYTMRFGDNSVEYSCFVGNNKILYLKAEMATYLDPAALKIRMQCNLCFGSIKNDKRIIENFIRCHITHEELIVKTCPKADFLNFLEDNVGVHFGHRRHNDMVVIENNLLGELNVLATKLLGAAFYDTVVVLNEQNGEY